MSETCEYQIHMAGETGTGDRIISRLREPSRLRQPCPPRPWRTQGHPPPRFGCRQAGRRSAATKHPL